jgi:hypothetical protein
VRKSRWAWFRGLLRGAGLDEASSPDLGVRKGFLGEALWSSFEAAAEENRFPVIEG